ncbi:MAG: hypothetical protein QOK48_2652 [Blastocatellia bacterium]|nr:hypothetical protein [Blastocatellia bacterium]
MRKSILLISGVGLGAGLLYALTRGRNQAGLDQGQNGNGKAELQEEPSTDRSNVTSFDTGASMRPVDGRGKKEIEPVIDDLGTNQHDAAEILKAVRDGAFEANDEKLALALGRPVEEIEAWASGDGTIDGDAVMKARHLAEMRGVEIQ